MNENGDLLAEWLKLGREVLANLFPDAKYATLVIGNGDDVPDTVICVTPRQQTSPTPNPQPS